jgi:hypothetical protein
VKQVQLILFLALAILVAVVAWLRTENHHQTAESSIAEVGYNLDSEPLQPLPLTIKLDEKKVSLGEKLSTILSYHAPTPSHVPVAIRSTPVERINRSTLPESISGERMSTPRLSLTLLPISSSFGTAAQRLSKIRLTDQYMGPRKWTPTGLKL